MCEVPNLRIHHTLTPGRREMLKGYRGHMYRVLLSRANSDLSQVREFEGQVEDWKMIAEKEREDKKAKYPHFPLPSMYDLGCRALGGGNYL